MLGHPYTLLGRVKTVENSTKMNNGSLRFNRIRVANPVW